MAPDSLRRLFLGALVVLCLAPGLDAQRGRAGRRPPAGGKQAQAKAGTRPGQQSPAAGKPRAAKPDASQTGGPGPAAPTLSEADLVTGAADLARELEEAQRYALHQHFPVLDLDGNGWLSLREAEITLSVERAEYQLLDADHDGRLLEAELLPQKDRILARLGALHPRQPIVVLPPPGPEEVAEAPTPPEEPPAPRVPRFYPAPVHLLAQHDADHSGGLATDEVVALLAEIRLQLSADMVVGQMDQDDSGQLEAGELWPLCFLVARHLPPPTPSSEVDPDAPTDSPAGTEPETLEATSPPLQGRTHFARLDPSADGAIDDTDLRALQSPARLGVRVEAVLSALDENGDGRLSEAEFRRAMGLR
jgi:Ca2+-binding EF-hand superfamily protein